MTSDQRVPQSHAFRQEFRIRRAADFRRAYERRRSASDDVLIVYACENGLLHPRLGLSVSRKVGNAVRRNRWKRLLREAFRLGRGELPSGLDLVVIPRPTANANLTATSQSLVKLAHRLSRRIAKEGT